MSEPVQIWFERSFVCNMNNLLVNAKENAEILLMEHDGDLGRTIRKNKIIAEMYEKEISDLEYAIGIVRDRI